MKACYVKAKVKEVNISDKEQMITKEQS